MFQIKYQSQWQTTIVIKLDLGTHPLQQENSQKSRSHFSHWFVHLHALHSWPNLLEPFFSETPWLAGEKLFKCFLQINETHVELFLLVFITFLHTANNKHCIYLLFPGINLNCIPSILMMLHILRSTTFIICSNSLQYQSFHLLSFHNSLFVLLVHEPSMYHISSFSFIKIYHANFIFDALFVTNVM